MSERGVATVYDLGLYILYNNQQGVKSRAGPHTVEHPARIFFSTRRRYPRRPPTRRTSHTTRSAPAAHPAIQRRCAARAHTPSQRQRGRSRVRHDLSPLSLGTAS